MEITLKELLDQTLVVPYEEEIVIRLTEVCNSYVDDEDEFNDDTVADLCITVLTHTSDTALKKDLEKLYQDKYEESFIIPKSVCETLAAYILVLAMEKNYTTYKVALLNTLIIQNEQLERLPYATFFANAVQDALNEVGHEGELEQADEAAFVKKIFESKDTTPISIDGNEQLIAKNIIRKAWYFDTREYIKSDDLKNLTTYAKVYKALTHIVYSMAWDFYNAQAMMQIKEIVPAANTKAKSIEEIVKMVRLHYDKDMDIKCRSSVLLHVIADENHQYNKLPFMKSKLTVRQFAVWLYYELLLEKYFA